MAAAASGEIVVSREEIHGFVIRCLTTAGAEETYAKTFADCLITADYRGHYSHGVNRLEFYIEELKRGILCGGKGTEPTITKQNLATALVNGNNLFGPVVGKFCMELAIKKAKEVGIGMVTARGSNHFGIAGWYSLMACEQGLLGMAFTNASGAIIPTRSKVRTLGTNPVCMAAPGKNGDSFVLDMATSNVAWGKVELQVRKGQPLSPGWVLDKDGKPTVEMNNVGGLLPLGGMEETSGYKGYGLSMMVEVLCSVLAGSPFGPFIRMWRTYDKPSDMAHCFIAVDPNSFEDGFSDRLQDLIDHCRNLETADDAPGSVMIAGDPERKHMKLCDSLGGIPYHLNQIKNMDDLAEKLNLEKLKRTSP
ncbi:uncharacterized oxidoreductase YjmC-like [Ylistrum balloti]|uniref:uncharacterized oxidoreductase YjmC-like n=1 Tax=Ylistrum balloti TaxID=509963 RepID=UPI002905B720|nr:uncharacterized oxidoreductase YjmC-like [Ylistrum balloti]